MRLYQTGKHTRLIQQVDSSVSMPCSNPRALQQLRIMFLQQTPKTAVFPASFCIFCTEMSKTVFAQSVYSICMTSSNFKPLQQPVKNVKFAANQQNITFGSIILQLFTGKPSLSVAALCSNIWALQQFLKNAFFCSKSKVSSK